MGIGNLDATFAATLAVATLDAAGGTLTSLGGTATAADVDVLVLLDTSGFANVGAAEDEYTGTANDVTDDDGLVVVYYDNAVGYVRVAFDAAEGTDSGGGVTVIADLTSLTAATDPADFGSELRSLIVLRSAYCHFVQPPSPGGFFCLLLFPFFSIPQLKF